MNRPEGISESAWETAEMLVVSVDGVPTEGHIYNVAKAIQSSVEAERAACAQRASDWFDKFISGYDRTADFDALTDAIKGA